MVDTSRYVVVSGRWSQQPVSSMLIRLCQLAQFTAQEGQLDNLLAREYELPTRVLWI